MQIASSNAFMNDRAISYMERYYPQNYLLRRPLAGALATGLFCFLFMVVYKPIQTHASFNLSYVQTMGLYSLVAASAMYFIVRGIKGIVFFADHKQWNLFKEFVAGFFVLLGMGLVVYLLGFVIEPPAPRWNIGTLVNSCLGVFLVGVIPFAFSMAINHHFFIPSDSKGLQNQLEPVDEKGHSLGEIIAIQSKNLKSHFILDPCSLVYAEAEGNYVLFFYLERGELRKVVVRNSMANVEAQLSEVSYLLRVHRAYIVNLARVKYKHGNSLGYRLKIDGIHFEIPVSRQKTTEFDLKWPIAH